MRLPTGVSWLPSRGDTMPHIELRDLIPGSPARRGGVPRERIIEEFQETLALVGHPESLYASILRGLEELFDCQGLALLLLETDWNVFRSVGARGFPPERMEQLSFRPADNLVNWLRVNEAPLEVEPGSGIFRFLSQPEQETLVGLGVKICVPLVSMNRIIGLLMLGPRRGRAYTEQDVSLLAALAAQAALAVENALLNQQQTERLRQMYRAERLATAGQLASGVAHEIRNPLTAIRSTIQLLSRDFQGDAGKRELLESVVAEVDRINQIITQLLSFARASEFAVQPVALNSAIEFSLSLVAAQARMQNVRITRRAGAGAGGARRRGAAQAALPEPAPQQPASDARWRGAAGGIGVPGRGRQDSARFDQRQRLRHERGGARADLRSVLHYQARGDGAGAFGELRDRRAPPWRDPRPQRPRRGDDGDPEVFHTGGNACSPVSDAARPGG